MRGAELTKANDVGPSDGNSLGRDVSPIKVEDFSKTITSELKVVGSESATDVSEVEGY